MKTALLLITSILSIAIIALTLFQGKESGLGNAWGGSMGSFQTRRGLEKWILRITAVLVFVFFVVSILNLIS